MLDEGGEYRREVEEWTSSMRSEPSFGDLRAELAEKGIDWNTALLICCLEDQEGDEQGAIVSSEGRVYRFTRVQNRSGEWRFARLADVTDDPRRWDFPDQIEAARAMVAGGAARPTP